MPTLNFRKGTTVSGITLYENSAFCANTPIAVRYHGATYYADTTTASGSYNSKLRVRIPGQSEVRSIATQSLLHPIAFQGVNARLGFPFGQPPIGDTEGIVLNGYITEGLTLSNESFVAVVIGVMHNGTKETNSANSVTYAIRRDNYNVRNIAFVDSNYNNSLTTGNTFHMNTAAYSGKNWRTCYMSSTVMSKFYNALPQAVKNVIVYTQKSAYSPNDNDVLKNYSHVFLLSEFELRGKCVQSHITESVYQQQYEYFKNNNDFALTRHDSNGVPAAYWTRSQYKSNATEFLFVDESGAFSRKREYYSLGVMPCFNVG